MSSRPAGLHREIHQKERKEGRREGRKEGRKERRKEGKPPLPMKRRAGYLPVVSQC
jgi:predicted transposase YdaD